MAILHLVRRIAAPLRDRRGATAVEYGLICALIVLGVIGAIRGLADLTTGTWNTVSNAVQAAR